MGRSAHRTLRWPSMFDCRFARSRSPLAPVVHALLVPLHPHFLFALWSSFSIVILALGPPRSGRFTY